jgi:hypothetical protein
MEPSAAQEIPVMEPSAAQEIPYILWNPQLLKKFPKCYGTLSCSRNSLNVMEPTAAQEIPYILWNPQLLKKCPKFYGTEKFITVLTTACWRKLHWTRWKQPTSSHYTPTYRP